MKAAGLRTCRAAARSPGEPERGQVRAAARTSGVQPALGPPTRPYPEQQLLPGWSLAWVLGEAFLPPQRRLLLYQHTPERSRGKITPRSPPGQRPAAEVAPALP